MRRQRWWLPLLALVLTTSWKPTLTLPVPDEELDTSTKLLGSSVVTSVSVVTGSSENRQGGASSNADRSRVIIPYKELPGSPADLLRPDRFQFYTLNKDGDVVTKQMSQKEIQSLIAAGGGHLPLEIHEPQNAGEVPSGGMKVADVVQNVQNVLKGELSKPATVMTSMPTIPGHANTEWSSILPAILGGEPESGPVSDPVLATITDMTETSVVADTTHIKLPDSEGSQTAATKLPAKRPSATVDYDSKKKPIVMTESESYTEKPMIQVPVITVDQKLPAQQDEEDSMLIFQMLNTISADKINAKNNTKDNTKPEAVQSQITDQPAKEEILIPEKVTINPIIQRPSIVQSFNVDTKVPEMVEINQTLKKPTEKPNLMTLTTPVISKLPQTEPPASVSVISETHSTSMKVSGQEEIPLRKPSKPIVQSTGPINLPSEEQKPVVTKRPIMKPTSDAKLDSTTVKAEPSVNPTEVSVTMTSEKPGLIAQGVSFFGNLPQTVTDIVTGFISNNAQNSNPVVGEIESTGTENSVKKPQSTAAPSSQATPIPNPNTHTSKKPDEEPAYQMIPEIILDENIKPQGASPSETSSIEHIIETLNDPTGSLSGTVASDHYDNQADPAKIQTVTETQASTAATPINVETLVEISSAKPMEPLPTELADSLSSVISQISDAMASVLPISEDAGLDTTEKKNVIDLQAEEPSTNETKTESDQVPMMQDKPANKIQLPLQDKLETPAILSTKAPENQNPMNAAIDAAVTTEKLFESSSTTSMPVSNESENLNSSTTVKIDLALTDIVKMDVPANKIDGTQILANKEPEVLLTNPQKVEPEADPVLASSEIATDKIDLVDTTEAIVVPQDAVVSEPADAEPEKKISTEEPVTTASSATSVVTAVASHGSGAPPKIQADSLGVLETFKPESQQDDSAAKETLNENNTEMPMIHINITEAKPTDMVDTNKSPETGNQDNETESPLVRIQLTDPVTLINNMINSAKFNASSSSLVPLTLPETGSVPPNNIASGLIAGFPSPTTQATSEMNPTTIDFVLKSQADVFVNGTTGAVETGVTKSDNNTKTLTPEITEVKPESNATKKTETLEVSSSKDTLTIQPEVTLQTTESPIESVVSVEPEQETTISSNMVQQTSTKMPTKAESTNVSAPVKSAEVEVPSTTVALQALLDDSNVTKLANAVSKETTTEMNVALNAEATTNETKASAIAEPEQLESSEENNGASKKVLTTINKSAMTEVTAGQTESLATKIPDATTVAPEKSEESTNTTMPEVPIVRINVAPETVPEAMPAKIQLDDLPIVETTTVAIKPVEAAKIQTHSSKPTTTVSSTDNSAPNLGDSLQVTAANSTALNSTKITVMGIGKDEVNLEEVTKQQDMTKSSAGSDSSEKIFETVTPIPMFQQTEEVRIRVNNTAVLVTKRPVSEPSGQTLEDIQKTTANQPLDEQSTTPKIVPVTENSIPNLVDEEEHLPVPLKDNESTPNNNAALVNTLTNTDSISSSTNETRIRLGDEQSNKESTTAKIEDTRKPIKKNSDSDSSELTELKPTISSTPKIPPASNNKDSILDDKDSNSQPSIKVELTTSAPSDKSATPSNISSSSKLEDKPIKLNDKKPPTKVADRPGSKPSEPSKPKPTMNIKKVDTIPGPADEKWTLIPQQIYPALTKNGATHAKRPATSEQPSTIINQAEQKVSSSHKNAVSLDHPQSASGLDSTVQNLETDITYFANLCNELAFTFWTATNKGLSTSRSLAVSPFGMTSMLAMVFLGARGPTSDQMNDILKLDDVSSFNPHLVFQNVTDAVGLVRNQGIANAAFVRELFADRTKVRKLMPFYKEQAQQFYDGIVAEVNFATISDLVRRRTNLMIRKQTGGRIKDFVRTNTVPLRSPLAAMSANVFQTDCNSSAASSEGRDGELYFAVSPAVRQRKLVPVPATVWRAGVLAGYEPSLDATAIALGGTDKLVSTIFVIPGQQGHTAPGDSLDHLEQRFITDATHSGAWNRLLKVLIPRPGLELQVPKFSHRSVINATAALKRMGLEELFSKHADLKGINGIATDLHLADVLQMNLFSTCGDENIMSGRHHVEVYPGSPSRNARTNYADERDKDEYWAEEEVEEVVSGSEIPHETVAHREARSARQTESTDAPRLKLDRPFLFFVRHNPTGLILHMGRFNPRLLP